MGVACLNPKRKNQLWEAGKCATCQADIRRLSILSRRPCYGACLDLRLLESIFI
ncbi:hypothetical protein YC2023_090651 [Brassica napus]|nr:unnamed protein product [Brassica napus]